MNWIHMYTNRTGVPESGNSRHLASFEHCAAVTRLNAPANTHILLFPVPVPGMYRLVTDEERVAHPVVPETGVYVLQGDGTMVPWTDRRWPACLPALVRKAFVFPEPEPVSQMFPVWTFVSSPITRTTSTTVLSRWDTETSGAYWYRGRHRAFSGVPPLKEYLTRHPDAKISSPSQERN